MRPVRPELEQVDPRDRRRALNPEEGDRLPIRRAPGGIGVALLAVEVEQPTAGEEPVAEETMTELPEPTGPPVEQTRARIARFALYGQTPA